MEFDPTANRLRFVLGELRIHAAFHHTFENYLVDA
ncbi:hypothetical protein ShzoTeo12_16170 [Shinella zoogloeoides]|nr:hypothetical protein ShzoTeo12_16170 [Shinella zoogloeoides]